MIVGVGVSDGDIDVDADITDIYGVPSPRPYPVTTRGTLATVEAGDNGEGEEVRARKANFAWVMRVSYCLNFLVVFLFCFMWRAPTLCCSGAIALLSARTSTL